MSRSYSPPLNSAPRRLSPKPSTISVLAVTKISAILSIKFLNRREAWRRHPVFSRRQQLKNLFPGFGIALVAFSGYVVWDNLSSPNSETIQKLRDQTEEQMDRNKKLLNVVTGQTGAKTE
ncbi:hypothetical protein O181_004106 [Austropuccinia psidii MF-1]|uniref:Uncharacterized protein n=1 Tax=Austropuccinia psidii MF-1 TaxID=1389203 RepID=A0A9Q3BG86_9BASI|nr:hypothetical protein [Austropuccinia psidii MF-1]